MPWAAAIRTAQLRGVIEWYARPGLRPRARARTERFLASTGQGAAVREDPAQLARRRHIERKVLTEIGWRRWRAHRVRIEGIERLETACAGGRGAIIATAHLGPLRVLVEGLAALGHKPYSVRGPLFEGRRLSGLGDRWILQQFRFAEEKGARYVVRGRAYPICRALLARGEVCRMHVDIPGTARTRVGEGEFGLAAGIASLACELGVAVVPAFETREGRGLVGRLLEPVEPADFPDARRLHAHLVAVLLGVMLDHPEQLHRL